MLVLCLGIAGTFVGCSSNPSKKKLSILDHKTANKPTLIRLNKRSIKVNIMKRQKISKRLILTFQQAHMLKKRSWI
jgi:type IV pilus biogenesis protein CpaD/CtpE